MNAPKLPLIEVGYQVFAAGGDEEFGAVRDVAPGGRAELVVYVENGGHFTIPLAAVTAVHDQKVVVDLEKVDPTVREAARRAHDRESL
jgi:hypothetical protein